MRKEIVYAFIDCQNLHLGIQSQGWKLDFKQFRVYLKDKFNVEKAFIFIGYIKKYENLYSGLREYGYEIIFKPVVQKPNGEVKGNIDAELVLKAMTEYNNYDKAVIVTGDGDFHCLIDHLKKNGKLRKLLIPNKKSFSSLLRKFLTDAVFLSDLRGKLELKNGRH